MVVVTSPWAPWICHCEVTHWKISSAILWVLTNGVLRQLLTAAHNAMHNASSVNEAGIALAQ